MSAEQIFALPEAVRALLFVRTGQIQWHVQKDRVKVAGSFKTKGNAAYQAKNFEEAAELYTKAIQVSPKSDPIFYSNRAACTSLLFWRLHYVLYF